MQVDGEEVEPHVLEREPAKALVLDVHVDHVPVVHEQELGLLLVPFLFLRLSSSFFYF